MDSHVVVVVGWCNVSFVFVITNWIGFEYLSMKSINALQWM